MVRIKYFLQYCKIGLLVLFALNKAADICHDNKPCQDRGGCFIIEETEQGFLSTYCVCVRGYSGRWCQFQGKTLINITLNYIWTTPQCLLIVPVSYITYIIIQLTPNWGFSVTDSIKYYAHLTYTRLFIFTTIEILRVFF
jgi:hypothetical protein